ncbi:H-NS histone family protein [Frigidibacter albus]
MVALARGYSLAEFVGAEVKTARAPAPAKYRPPENPALTWSGRGRKPQGIADALAAVRTADNFTIA